MPTDKKTRRPKATAPTEGVSISLHGSVAPLVGGSPLADETPGAAIATFDASGAKAEAPTDMHSYLGSTGIRLDGVCGTCDGDGKLEAWAGEIIACPDCGGLGGRTAEDGARGRAASEAYKAALFGDEATEGVSLAGEPDGSVTPGEPEGAFTHSVEWAAPHEVSITLPNDGTIYKVYEPYAKEPVFVWPPTLPAYDFSLTPTEPRVSAITLNGDVHLVSEAVADEHAALLAQVAALTDPVALVRDHPSLALAVYRLVSKGYALAEWKPLGQGAMVVDLATGATLAQVSPDGVGGWCATYVEGHSNASGPTDADRAEVVAKVERRMKARGCTVIG